MLQVHPIFQTPVFLADLPGMTETHGLDAYIQQCCRETLGTFGPTDVIQSRYDLNRDPKLGTFCEAVFGNAYAIAREVYRYSPDYVVEITSMWGNVQRPGAVFRSHVHHNNVFSGVFYLNEDPDFPEITFWRPSETTLDPRKVQYNIFNQGSFKFKVKKDTLVIFPAWLHHSVDINRTSKDRLGISFNIMLRGDYYNTVL